MKFSIIIILSFTFCSLDSSKNHIPSNYFKNLKLKTLKMNPEDILNTQSVGQDKLFLSQRQIDSIKVISQEFTPSPVSEKDTILIQTSKGAMKLIYYPSVAPKHCYNFKKLANSGFYDNTKFHRVIKNFMIQGGDVSPPPPPIPDEFDSTLSNIQKTISMANSGPNTGTCQFFINLVDNTYLDFDKPPFTSKHPVFGITISGFNIVEDIGDVQTNFNDVPYIDVIMDSVRIVGNQSSTNFITSDTKNKLLKIVDMLGRETYSKLNTPLFYIYENGEVRKFIVQ